MHEATTELVGNAIELDLDEAWVERARRAAPRRPRRHARREHRAVHGDAGRADRGRPGARSTWRFRGTLNDKLRGFYRSTFTDADGNEQVIATTQMQATDCRRAFPCWDEPDLKAVFGVTLVVPDDLLAISNGPEVEREPTGDGKVRLTFADTMAMSTYLVAFVVGPLEATAPVDVDGTPLRVVHVPGQGSPHRASRLEIGAFALRWFQDYYAHPLPGRQGRPRRPPRLRRRRHGEPRLHHVPRDRSARRPGHGHPGGGADASPTSWPTSWPTCGSATSSRCGGGTASG